jgi:hypothetical protein
VTAKGQAINVKEPEETRMQRKGWAMFSAALVMACGGGVQPAGGPTDPPPAPASSATDTAAPDTAADPAPTHDTAADTPRARDAAKWLQDMSTEEPSLRGILATNGLSEGQFGLPEPLRKGMEAATSGKLDPSQADRILVASLEEGAADLVQKLCGKPVASVVADAMAAPADTRAKLVVDRCKLAPMVDLTNVPKDSFMFPLLSAVVQKLFEAEGGHAQAEFELATMIAAARRPAD